MCWYRQYGCEHPPAGLSFHSICTGGFPTDGRNEEGCVLKPSSEEVGCLAKFQRILSITDNSEIAMVTTCWRMLASQP